MVFRRIDRSSMSDQRSRYRKSRRTRSSKSRSEFGSLAEPPCLKARAVGGQVPRYDSLRAMESRPLSAWKQVLAGLVLVAALLAVVVVRRGSGSVRPRVALHQRS